MVSAEWLCDICRAGLLDESFCNWIHNISGYYYDTLLKIAVERFDPLIKLKSVHPGHFYIQKDQIIVSFVDTTQGIRAV